MKTLLLLVGLALSYTASAQWVSKHVDNGFDEPYNIAYTENRGSYLKLENSDGEIFLYIGGGYTCDDELTVEASFIINGEYSKYTFRAVTSDDRKNVFFVSDLLNETCLADFKACSSVKIRINDTACSSEVYTFNMSGSTAALKFVINQ
jgi:hypothetical protein